MLRNLFQAYLSNPLQLPDTMILAIINNVQAHDGREPQFGPKTIGEKRKKIGKLHKEGSDRFKRVLARSICDYLAGLTDEYALSRYENLYESVHLKNF